MALGTRANKQTPFRVVVLSGTVDNENGVMRKFHPGMKKPTILRVPDDISYRNIGKHISAGRMEYIDEKRATEMAGKDTKAASSPP